MYKTYTTLPFFRYTEKDWNPTTYEEAKNTDHGGIAYCASKVLAEKAGWEFMKENGNLSFDLARMQIQINLDAFFFSKLLCNTHRYFLVHYIVSSYKPSHGTHTWLE